MAHVRKWKMPLGSWSLPSKKKNRSQKTVKTFPSITLVWLLSLAESSLLEEPISWRNPLQCPGEHLCNVSCIFCSSPQCIWAKRWHEDDKLLFITVRQPHTLWQSVNLPVQGMVLPHLKAQRQKTLCSLSLNSVSSISCFFKEKKKKIQIIQVIQISNIILLILNTAEVDRICSANHQKSNIFLPPTDIFKRFMLISGIYTLAMEASLQY